MPYIDLDNIKFSTFVNEFDYTIAGAGAAGIMLSIKLSEAGNKVLLIESGHFSIDEKIQQLNEVEQVGKTMGSAQWGRKRAIGGTTLAWGGQSLPFSPIDFAERSWTKNKLWPISYEELFPYYEIANEFMGITDSDYKGDGVFEKIKLRKRPNIDKRLLDYHVSKWAKEPNFKKQNSEKLEKDVFVLYNASLDEIHQQNGLIQSVTIKSHKNLNYRLTVKTLILTLGGIECNRILFQNSHLFQESKQQNVLGKGFMDHPCLEIGTVFSSQSYKLQKYFNTHIYKNQKISVRLSLSENEQTRHKLLNCSASIFFLPIEHDNPYELVKSLLKKFDIKRTLKLFKHLPVLIQALYALTIDRFYFKNKARVSVLLMVEQEALTGSNIYLSERRNYIDQPLAKINWEISPLTWKTVIHTAHLLEREFKNSGLGKLELYSSINIKNKDWKSLLTDVNHHMGGTIMGSSEEQSIVDKNLKVWGIENLYVCSCSVFPSSSHSNPTLTMLALSARLVNYLKNKF